MKKLISKNNQSGFTIVEMMVASLVFSVILIILTFGVIQITHDYYKGITQGKTQDTARTITGDITQALEFDGAYTTLGTTTGTNGVQSQGFCVGNQRFSYLLSYELGSSYNSATHTAPHSLVTDNTGGCTVAQDLTRTSLSAGSRELMGSSMRLANLSITSQGSGGLYKVIVTVAYGDQDLLNSPNSVTPTCISQTGNQFCYVSTLSTTITARVGS